MKCPRCNTVMAWEHDRQRCIICGHSIWHDFQLRAPAKSEKITSGRPAGNCYRGD